MDEKQNDESTKQATDFLKSNLDKLKLIGSIKLIDAGRRHRQSNIGDMSGRHENHLEIIQGQSGGGDLGCTRQDAVGHLQLFLLQLHDSLLHGALGNHPVNVDVFLLADTVDAVAGLGLQLRIPVHVSQKEMIPADQVQTNTSGTQRQKHYLCYEIKTIRNQLLVRKLHLQAVLEDWC